MSLEDLSDALLGTEALHQGLRGIALDSVLADLPVERATDNSPIPWPFMLRAASVLCRVPHEQAQEAALWIAQGCLTSAHSGEDERVAASILLERMGNRRAISLAAKRELVDPETWNDSPVPLKLDVIRRRLELSIITGDGGSIEANPFQREFWSAAAKHRWVSVSAPTSAGKSFIVRTWLNHQAERSSAFRAAYIVPTRALIEEVARELKATAAKEIGVYTLPWDAEVGSRAQEIYVMTQERLHLLLGHDPALTVDTVFVDEAQKFGDDRRGVLLQQVLDECVRRKPDSQVLLASPLTSNPEVLLDGAPANGSLPIAIRGTTVTVNQNLLWADQAMPGKPRDWKLQLVADGEPRPAGTFTLPFSPESPTKRLPLVAMALGGNRPGNIVYVSIPSDAEKVALQIHDGLGDEASLADDPEVAALRDLVDRTVHPKYALAKTLERGVAFHYGSMPQLIRQEVERLFSEEKLRYLVCTSTLLEGVNLPCRLLFLRSSKKGQKKWMTPGDFWNLAGRAGRWGKEFQGNVICVDVSNKSVWPDPPRKRTLQTISRAADPSLEETSSLLKFIQDGAPASEARKESTSMHEAVYSFLSARMMTVGTLAGVPALADGDAQELEKAVEEALNSVPLPSELLLRHAGIGPLAMGRLLTHFRGASDWHHFLLPTTAAYGAASVYADALGICHDILGTNFGGEKRRFALGLLITEWVQGRPLSVIIGSRLRWLRKNRPNFKLSTEIRNVMKDVETVARFQAPKYLGCYLDVLGFYLQSIGEEETAAELPDISMMLELGVSRTTEVSLMTIGLSRTSAVALSEFIVEEAFSREEALTWLRERDLEAYPLPNLVIEEIRRVVPDSQSSA